MNFCLGHQVLSSFQKIFLKPYSGQACLLFKGPGGGLEGPRLMISGTIQASPMKLCTALVLLKAYQTRIQKQIFRPLQNQANCILFER